jgi:Mrp family chromosome partitioning ATPase
LIATLSNNYDYIIFDTPPLAGMADTTLLGRMIDGVLMVVRPNVLDSDSAIAAKKLLLNTNQNILGMVANCVDTRHEPSSTGYFYQPDRRYQNQA